MYVSLFTTGNTGLNCKTYDKLTLRSNTSQDMFKAVVFGFE